MIEYESLEMRSFLNKTTRLLFLIRVGLRVFACGAFIGCSSEHQMQTPNLLSISPEASSLKFLSSELNAGELPVNSCVSFQMTTTAQSIDTVSLVNKSCGCFKVFRGDIELNTGDVFTISATTPQQFSLHFERLKRPHDSIDQSIIFTHNNLMIPFHASIEITPPIFTIPGSLSAKTSDGASVAHARFQVVATATEQSKLAEQLGVFFEPPVPGGALQVVETGAIETYGSRHFRKNWLVEARYPSSLVSRSAGSKIVNARIELPGSGSDYVLSNVSISVLRSSGLASPTALYFGAIPRDVLITRKFVVRSLDGIPFRIKRSSTQMANIHLVSEDKDLATHVVQCQLACSEIGNFRKTLSVPTTHPESPILEISLSGRIVE